MKPIDWKAHIEAQAKTDLSAAAYCRRHQISKRNFYAERSKLLKQQVVKASPFVEVLPTLSGKEPSQGFQINLSIDASGAVQVSGVLPHLGFVKELFGAPQ